MIWLICPVIYLVRPACGTVFFMFCLVFHDLYVRMHVHVHAFFILHHVFVEFCRLFSANFRVCAYRLLGRII